MFNELLGSVGDLLDAERPEQVFYLDGFLAAGQVLILTSAPGIGKSYLTVLWSLLIAGGANWYDKLVAPEPVPVLYLLTDGTEDDMVERVTPVKNEGLTNAFTEANWRWSPMPLNLTTNGNASRAVLSNIITQRGIKVVFIDSLYSSMEGDPSDGKVAIVLAQKLKDLKKEHPDVAWVILHHDKKKSLTAEGNVMNDPNPFLGSQYLNAMIDQMWNYQKDKPQDTSARLTQLKSRSNSQRMEDWRVDFDPDTGALTPAGKSNSTGLNQFKAFLRNNRGSEITRGEMNAWANGLDVKDKTLERWMTDLRKANMLKDIRKGVYEYGAQPVTVQGVERTLDLES